MMTAGDYVPASFSCTLLVIMPRDGAFTLSDVRSPVLTVVCDPCGRRERHDVERLTRQYGWDAKLVRLTADCPKRGSVSIHDRCKAVYERRPGMIVRALDIDARRAWKLSMRFGLAAFARSAL